MDTKDFSADAASLRARVAQLEGALRELNTFLHFDTEWGESEALVALLGEQSRLWRVALQQALTTPAPPVWTEDEVRAAIVRDGLGQQYMAEPFLRDFVDELLDNLVKGREEVKGHDG